MLYLNSIRDEFTQTPSKEVIRHVDEVLKLMNVLTNDERFLEIQNAQNSGGVATMCEALDYAEQKGRIAGEEIGKRIGRTETYFALVKDGIIDVSMASRRCDLSEDEFLKGYSEFCKK